MTRWCISTQGLYFIAQVREFHRTLEREGFQVIVWSPLSVIVTHHSPQAMTLFLLRYSDRYPEIQVVERPND